MFSYMVATTAPATRALGLPRLVHQSYADVTISETSPPRKANAFDVPMDEDSDDGVGVCKDSDSSKSAPRP